MPEMGSRLIDSAKNAVANDKVLIAVDRFPATGGSRIDKFVKLLPDFGLEPIVLSAAETDSEFAQEIKGRLYPPRLKTFVAKSIGWSYFTERFLMRGRDARHYFLLSLLSFPERCVLIPDYMVRWIPLGIRAATRIIRDEDVRVVLTSSPSESVHLIGLSLKRKLGIRWVADFRDLWTEKALLYRPATPLHDWWVRRLERKVFRFADHIIANTPENADRYVHRFGLSPDRITVIPNGFDREDMPSGRGLGVSQRSTKFRLGYSGSLDKHDFPWRIALLALKKLAQDVGRDRVRLVHCGYLSEAVKSYLRQEEIEDLVEAHGNLSHADAMVLTANTEIRLVLLYENAYSESIVPMKLYNYLIMNGPILAIAPEAGRMAAIIRETRMGVVISKKRGASQVYVQLQKYFKEWESGQLAIEPNLESIAQYDRRVQTMNLARLLRVDRKPPIYIKAAQNLRDGADKQEKFLSTW